MIWKAKSSKEHKTENEFVKDLLFGNNVKALLSPPEMVVFSDYLWL